MHSSSVLLLALLATACAGDDAARGDAPTEAVLTPHTWGATRPLHVVGDVYLAGQPSPEALALAAGEGVRTVLDLRHDAETPELDERDVVEDLGMTYVHYPWNGPDELDDEVFDDLRGTLRDAERPLLFHCASSNRVGAVWFAYRVLDEGVPLEAALDEAKRAGLRSPAYEAEALDYVRRRR